MEDCPDDVSSSFIHSPCVICGGEFVGVKTEVLDDDDEDSRIPKKNLEDLHLDQLRDAIDSRTSQLLQFFFKLFRVKPEEKWSVWRCESGEDQKSSLFCHLCKHRLEVLEELQEKVEELKEQLKNGREELKEVMESSEEGLQKQGIYKRDKIFYRIRRQIFQVTNERKANNSNVDPWEKLVEECDSGGRTSSRSSAKGKLSSSSLATTGEPRVLLSAADRECAEEMNAQLTVKNKNQSTWKIEELVNSEWVLPHSDEDEVNMTHSVISSDSSDPDYEEIQENQRKEKMKTKRRRGPGSIKTDIPKSIIINRIESNDEEIKPKRRRRTIKSTLSDESTSNITQFLDNDSADIIGAESAEKRIRTTRTKAMEKDYEDFIPAKDDDNDSSSESEDDVESDYDESLRRRGKYKRYQQYKYHIDETTGNYTVQGITLVKLPNNEFGKEQYKCTKCLKIIPIKSHTQDQLREHIWRTHSGRYKCKECGKELQKRAALFRHVESIHQNRTFPCPVCGKPFAYLSGVNKHKVSHLSEEEKRQQLSTNEKVVAFFQCEDCGFPAKTIQHLRSHRIRLHGTEEEKAKLKKLILCPECGKYVSYGALKVHMEGVHGTERNYPCVLCEKRFKTSAKLKQHQNSSVHKKELPFKCTLCTNTYPSQHRLNAHMQIHLNTRKFKCEYCPSAFNRKSHLQNHCSIYHNGGSNPKRPSFIRGPPKKGRITPNPSD